MRHARPAPANLALLGERLEALRREWRSRRLDSDPLVFAHRYADPADREVVAFLAASLAFGRVASIQASVARVLAALGPSPAEFLEEWDERPIAALRAFRHRWVSGNDIEDFLRMVKRARRAHGSLGALFAAGDEERGRDASGLWARPLSITSPPSPPFIEIFSFFLFSAFHAPLAGAEVPSALPRSGSACKRSHLFLRWMIRTEGFDLGLWTGGRFTPARLLLPMDTHVHRIARRLGLTRRKAADLAAAREATGVAEAHLAPRSRRLRLAPLAPRHPRPCP